jgi:hypothetical protein
VSDQSAEQRSIKVPFDSSVREEITPSEAAPATIRSPSYPLAITLCFLLGGALFLLKLHYYFLFDDSYITLRYAQNVADGKGFVFNQGERIEGASSPLWILLLAFLFRSVGLIHQVSLFDVSRCAGAILAALAAMSVFVFGRRHLSRLSQREDRENYSLLLFSALCFLVPPFVLWSISSLENGLYALLLVSYAHLLAIGAWRGAALAVLMLGLTRPEAVMFAILAIVPILWQQPPGWILHRPVATVRSFCRSGMARPFWQFVVIVVAGQLVITGVRFWYFGDLVPNTVRVKSGGDLLSHCALGLSYVGHFVDSNPGLSAIVLVSAIFLPFVGAPAIASVALAMLVLQVLFVVAVGGDWMSQYRFLASFVPLACLFCACVVVGAMRRPGIAMRSMMLASSLAALGISARVATKEYATGQGMHRVLNQANEPLGRWLREVSPASALLAVGDAGAIPYFSGLRTLDLHGLMDRHLAHFAGNFSISPHSDIDAGYVFDRRPTWLVVIATNSYQAEGRSVATYGLYDRLMQRPEFTSNYVFAREYNLVPHYWYHVYYDRTQLHEIEVTMDLDLQSPITFGNVYVNEDWWRPVRFDVGGPGRRMYRTRYLATAPARDVRIDPVFSAGIQISCFGIKVFDNGVLVDELTAADVARVYRSQLDLSRQSKDSISLVSSGDRPLLRFQISSPAPAP